jgi:acylphosphatase
MTSKRVHVTVAGRVQGVGIRYAVYRQAQALGLSGWVRNLPGGEVEGEFEGTPDAVDRILVWCRQGPPLALVQDVRVEEVPFAQHPLGFEIQ